MIGIALLGAGRMARVHAKGIEAAGGKLVTVFDVVKPAAASLAAEYSASVSGSAKAAAASLQLGKAIELKANCEVTWT
jgi:myo-inositol 2-dehydrogenase / D-chiro-inositol 1-dehydrogenase